MTDADKVINPQHFGSDPTDTQIRIRINREIRIRILDHFGFRLNTLAVFCALWAQSRLISSYSDSVLSNYCVIITFNVYAWAMLPDLK